MNSSTTVTINYKITLAFYGQGNTNSYLTLEGERYGFKTQASAKAWVTRYVVAPYRADGRVDERIRFFSE